jgi:hypothetical protein
MGKLAGQAIRISAAFNIDSLRSDTWYRFLVFDGWLLARALLRWMRRAAQVAPPGNPGR